MVWSIMSGRWFLRRQEMTSLRCRCECEHSKEWVKMDKSICWWGEKLEDGQRHRLELYVFDVERPIINIKTEVEDTEKIGCENALFYLSKLPTAKETVHLIIQNVFFTHGPSADIILDQAFSVARYLKASTWDTSSQKLFLYQVPSFLVLSSPYPCVFISHTNIF